MTIAAERETGVRSFPVVELFGPTIQGEGPDAGRRSFFVRLGGCDYRCSWCDSMHAVEPAEVRNAPRKHVERITGELAELGAVWDDLIVLSGGNPALHRCEELVAELHDRGLRVSVETQGSFWRPWLAAVDRLVVSPKAPSSGMATPRNMTAFVRFWQEARTVRESLALKIVVFDQADYEWAKGLLAGLAYRPPWVGLSCGTDAQGREELTETARRFRWLAEKVAADVNPALRGVVVLPQLHVVAWGHALGR